MRYFLTVAKEQSFTKAAEQLHITQPTLSRQLASLEDELGTTLFNRGGHSVTLTDAGLLLKRRALEIIDLEDNILIQKKLHPEIKSSTVIAWRRHIPYSKAINLFIEEINAFEA